MIERLTGMLWPIPGRRVVAGACLIIGMGRLGAFTSAAPTFVFGWLYGIALLLVGVALLLTENKKALTWYGRTVAGIGAGLVMGFGVDVGLTVGYLFNTSSMLLYWFAVVLFFEAGARREC